MRPIVLLLLLTPFLVNAQVSWNKDGNSYTTIEDSGIVQVILPTMTRTVLVSADHLALIGIPRRIANAGNNTRRGPGGSFQYQFSTDNQKVLISTKPIRIYHNTFYTVNVFDLTTNTLIPIGKAVPAPGLLNAKLSPDGSKVAYVYDNNIYTEDLATHTTEKLTTDGSEKN